MDLYNKLSWYKDVMKDVVDLLALEEKRLKANILLSFNSTPFVSAV